ncbi:MAG: cytochrome b/b6 domain-containing protein [Elusimicrobia bacterium]|nr:cytochrome b/b6 domain-containing protein [Elusimicrobiota bacterium]
MSERVYLFKRYERFWHWFQMAIVASLLVTGFEVHGTWRLLGFPLAALLHEAAATALVLLMLFTMFWHATTGEGRQFLPTRQGFKDQVRYYARGIFFGEEEGHVPSPEAKFNPVQRAAYFGLLVFLFPVQVGTGLLYLAARWRPDAVAWLGGLRGVALIHTAGAYALVCFLIVHLYMLSTGPGARAHLRAMVTGWHHR